MTTDRNRHEMIGTAKVGICRCGRSTRRYCRACRRPVCGNMNQDYLGETCGMPHRRAQRHGQACPA